MKTLHTQARGGRENYIVIQDPTQRTQGDRDMVVLLSCLENGCGFSILGEFNETVMSGVWIVLVLFLEKMLFYSLLDHLFFFSLISSVLEITYQPQLSSFNRICFAFLCRPRFGQKKKFTATQQLAQVRIMCI